ncbi:hypothetical protein [Streptomyces sp. JB150]|uniref:hypothetical protein n=1 Tax=Streptomyces sp. JB150 TaxID=2714844 RepID=UPI00140AAE8A|nr:hypothetical protein [Streptomyces sp. JB150]QIJ63483.1 hypothetical protein G7Z13_16675 [Streptomyces sp. JB150]
MGVPVSRVVRQVASEHAPGERDLLDAVEGMTPRDRRRHLAKMRRAPSTSTVEFGLEVVVPLVTPVLWLVLTEAARGAAATAVRASAQAARSRWRRWRGRAPEDEPELPLPLSAEQPGVVREAVLTRCVGQGGSANQDPSAGQGEPEGLRDWLARGGQTAMNAYAADYRTLRDALAEHPPARGIHRMCTDRYMALSVALYDVLHPSGGVTAPRDGQ